MSDDLISRNEFLAHLEPMREDIREMRVDIKTLLTNSNMEQGEQKAHTVKRSWLQTIPTVIAGALGSLITLAANGSIHHG